MKLLLLKLGGELIETAADRARIAGWAAASASRLPLVLAHGAGRAIDGELKRRHISPRKVDGLRITDAATLEAVVAVLAGTANTDLVSALVAQRVPAVGLTGVDAGFGRAVRTDAYASASGTVVDLELVGDPIEMDSTLLRVLLDSRYVPVVASLGVDERTGEVLNVNADVMACRMAASLPDCGLVIAGGTAGVLDDSGRTIERLDTAGIDALIAGGTATAGMVAKLTACKAALRSGVPTIRLIDGRALDGTHGVEHAPGTTLRA